MGQVKLLIRHLLKASINTDLSQNNWFKIQPFKQNKKLMIQEMKLIHWVKKITKQ